MSEQVGKILIVDDSALGLKMLNSALSQDYTVYLATTGEAALRQVAANRPDLILLDIMMPGMDGYEVCKALKQDSTYSDIPIIMISALNSIDDEIKGLELGAIDFISKPFNMGLVQMRVRNHLELKFQREQARQSHERHVTELQQLNQQLQEQEYFTRSALDGLSAHICVLDCHGTIIVTNRAWDEYAASNGTPQDACAVGVNYLDTCITASDSGDPDIVNFTGAIKSILDGTMASHSHEYPCHSPAVHRWFVCNINLFMVSGTKYAIISHEDITGRKLAEMELLKLSRAVEQSPASIVMTDLLGTIEFVNPRFTELTGYGFDESLGANPRILKSGETPPEVFIELWQTIAAGGTWYGEIVNKRKDGSLFWGLTSVSPIRNGLGEMTHYLAVCEDITANKKLIEELKIAKDHAEAATRAKSIFLSSMSHEIRTPMNGVIGMTILLSDTELSPEQRDFSETIRKSGENLLDIINDILDFSKIEAGKLDLELLSFNLCTMMEDTAELLSLRAAEKGLELLCVVDPAIPACMQGDEGRVRQILTNLAGNAIKFTGSGEIVLSATLKESRADLVTVLFEVTDTGIGIPADRLDAVFAPFTQAEGSTTRKFGGTGLGLAICKQLAEIMGGAVSVTSEYGRGSTFSFTVCFPLLAEESCQLPENSHSAVALQGTTVLIVDDNGTCRALLAALLERWGCRAVAAADGETGLALLREAAESGTPFQVALIDQSMPGIDGIELGRRIKADPLVAGTGLIMVTAFGQSRNRALLEEAGFSGYVAKPVRQLKLRDSMARAVGKTGRPDEAPAHSSAPSTENEKPVRSTRLLLAEDNIINQKVAQKTLNNLGYAVDVVANGLEAVRALEIFNYDAVLMDCQMPEMDGFEATAAIRDPGSAVLNHQVPIIAMTANAMSEDRDHCLQAGMDDYVSKPVKKEVLSEVLHRWLPVAKAKS